MKSLKIYDPAMCCSTGVCGPNVDEKLVNLAADVAFLKSHGIAVERFNLGHQPGAFAANPEILAEMGAEAENLPVFVVDGRVRSKGVYPPRVEMAAWFGLEAEALPAQALTELKLFPSKCCDSEGDGCC
ncbi:MAG: arsenite efflux transporter metallochaperone ArsD [Fimbriimonas sp.]|nr:arsenite efflux transporter metallochaperone ArsD [Fimbriimonas sp.]